MNSQHCWNPHLLHTPVDGRMRSWDCWPFFSLLFPLPKCVPVALGLLKNPEGSISLCVGRRINIVVRWSQLLACLFILNVPFTSKSLLRAKTLFLQGGIYFSHSFILQVCSCIVALSWIMWRIWRKLKWLAWRCLTFFLFYYILYLKFYFFQF